jgi:hypothetical protein
MSDINVTVNDQIVNVDVIDQPVLVAVSNAPGPQGPQGPTGATGPQGPAGANGAPGVGVPVGGTTNQVLAKSSATNYDTQWVNPSGSWGTITGTLSGQTDLYNALNAKFDDPTGDTTQYIAGDGSLVAFPITGQAGTLVREVRNVTGATLTKGTVVYINGAQGNKPTVAKALATTDPTSAQTFGLIQADIPNNSNGYLVAFGDLNGLNTSAFAEGVQLYLSATTAGAYTSVKQYAPNHLVYIGVVTRQHVNQGRIEVRIQNGYELDELHDVAAQTPTNNDGLFYNSTNSLWENKSIPTALGYTPVTNDRTLTINGVTQDLSANRTFTIPADSTQLVEHLLAGNSGFQYNNGASGVGATLYSIAVNLVNNGFLINGNQVSLNDKILVIQALNPAANGLYYYSSNVFVPDPENGDYWIIYLTRMVEYDQPSDFAKSILVRVTNKTYPELHNLFVGSITPVTTIGASEIYFINVDNGRGYGTNAQRPSLSYYLGKLYYQTDGVPGMYFYGLSGWTKLSTISQAVTNYTFGHAAQTYADGGAYYFGGFPHLVPAITGGSLRGVFNKSGRIRTITIFLRSTNSPSGETCNLSLFTGGTGSPLQQFGSNRSFTFTGTQTAFQWTGFNLQVDPLTNFELAIFVPTMVTNPATVIVNGVIEVEYAT